MKKIVLFMLLFFVIAASAVSAPPPVSVNYEEIKTLLDYPGEVLTMAFSPGGKMLAIGTKDEKVVLFDVGTWEMMKTIKEHRKEVSAVAFSRDGKYLASGDRGKQVKIFTTATWELFQKFKGYDDIESLSFSPDGNLLAAAGGNKEKATIWDIKKDDQAKKLKSARGDIRAIAFSSDGKYVAGGTSDNIVTIWDALSGDAVKTLSGHLNTVIAITYSPDGKQLASGDAENVIKIWDSNTGTLLKSLKGDSANRTCALSYIPNTNSLATGECKIFLGPFFKPTYVSGSGCKVVFWDTETGKPKKAIDVDCSLSSIAFSADGQYLAVGNARDNGKYITIYKRAD